MPTQVSIKMASGYNLITVNDWKVMPLPQRIEMITGGKVQFLQNGAPMDLRAALGALKAAA